MQENRLDKARQDRAAPPAGRAGAFSELPDSAKRVVVDVARFPDAASEIDLLISGNLPAFMMWSSPGNWRWHRIYGKFPEYQLAAYSPSGELLGALNSVPVPWDGNLLDLPGGYDDVLIQSTGVEPFQGRSTCLLSISVRESCRGLGIPELLLEEIKVRARNAGHGAVIAPLRPTLKHLHPSMPMSEYTGLMDERGKIYDPWLRKHLEMGAEVLGIAEKSLVIKQPSSRWERNAGRQLLAGRHPIPGAISQIEIGTDGVGIYVEPNIWICHRIAAV